MGNKTIVGIDPGHKGAIFHSSGELWDMADFYSGKIFVASRLVMSLASLPKPDIIMLEKAQVMNKGQRSQGAVSMFTYGLNYGKLLGALQATGYVVVEIAPSVWKGGMNLTQNKDDSLVMARRLFPKYEDKLKRKKDDGRAEAMLMCYFGQHYFLK